MRVIITLGLASLLLACGGDPKPEDGGAKQAGPWIFKNPMADTQIGEWAMYKLSDTEDANRMHLEVVQHAGKAKHVMVRTQIRGDQGRVIDNTVRPVDRNHFLNGYRSAGWIVMRMYPDEIFVAGRRFKCMCVEYLTRLSGNVKVWYSHEIPVWGMLRQVRIEPNMRETVNAEITDWSGK